MADDKNVLWINQDAARKGTWILGQRIGGFSWVMFGMLMGMLCCSAVLFMFFLLTPMKSRLEQGDFASWGLFLPFFFGAVACFILFMNLWAQRQKEVNREKTLNG